MGLWHCMRGYAPSVRYGQQFVLKPPLTDLSTGDVHHLNSTRQVFALRAGPAAPKLSQLRTARPSLAALYQEVGTDSVWTIDLAMLLHAHGVACALYTETVGVSSDLKSLGYYSGVLEADTPRVAALFGKAAWQGIPVVQRRVTVPQLAAALRGSSSHGGLGIPTDPRAPTRGSSATVSTQAHHTAFIVLTDSRHVVCTECVRMRRLLRFTFAGHYIVLLAYDPDSDLFAYADPAAVTGMLVSVYHVPCC